MNKKVRQRINFMIDPDMLESLDYVAKVLGKTRSSLINELLSPAMPPLLEVIRLAQSLDGLSSLERDLVIQKLGIVGSAAENNVDKLTSHLKKLGVSEDA